MLVIVPDSDLVIKDLEKQLKKGRVCLGSQSECGPLWQRRHNRQLVTLRPISGNKVTNTVTDDDFYVDFTFSLLCILGPIL